MLRADIEPADAVAGTVVAAIEPLDAKAWTLAAMIEMPNGKNPCRWSRLQRQETRLRFRQVRRRQEQQNETGDGAKECHSRLPEKTENFVSHSISQRRSKRRCTRASISAKTP